jgi:hypothetical protein
VRSVDPAPVAGDQHQHRADDGEDDADRHQDRYVEQQAEDEKDDSEDQHVDGVPVGEEVTCASCGMTFRKAWSDAEARAEYEENFPTTAASTEPTETVCEDCYRQILAWVEEKGLTR